MSKVIYSAIQPSGIMTLGNYIGAVDNWQQMQANEDNKCIFALADLHTITVRQDPKKFHENAMSFYALLMAMGLDPKKSILYFQSHVQEHAYLSWLLNCYTYVGEMNRMTQFKDKSAKHSDNINMGLMDYPVLMAADILLYRTDEVPVGIDQMQHIEIARDIAERVNGIYGDIFTIPKGVLKKVGAKIMSLQDPTQKMSKSDPNPKAVISVLDDDSVIMKKFKSAVTDSETIIEYDAENKPGVSNLLTILSVCENKPIDVLEKEFEGLMYGHLKIRTGEAVCEMLRPMKERYNQLMNDKGYLLQCAKEGAEKAREIARPVLDKFRQAIGYVLI